VPPCLTLGGATHEKALFILRRCPPAAPPAQAQPLGLALILGAGDLIKPAANLASLGPAFLYFASWYVLGALTFWVIGFETKGRSFEEIDSTLTASAAPSVGKVAAR
jgi:hypothetical protein